MTTRICRRRGCTNTVVGPSDFRFCVSCRSQILFSEHAKSIYLSNREALATASFWSATEHDDDWQVIDTNGDTVWAADLAKRYRAETMPRPR
jgi:hypothetical protein